MELERFRPKMPYLLIDEGAYPDDVLASKQKNLVAVLFRLENSQNVEHMRTVLRDLMDWLTPEQDSLRRAFTLWLRRVLLPRKFAEEEYPDLHNLEEVDNMLAERVQEWVKPWREEGREEGRKEGRKETLMLLLQTQFGPDLPQWVSDKLGTANTETIDKWTISFIHAVTLEDVFQC
jgi:hypothetical protein